MVNCLDRPTELRAASGFDLDERDRPIPLYNQINVATTVSEAPLDNPPAAPPKPSLCDSLSELAKRLPGR
jgi:hypothetical protein